MTNHTRTRPALRGLPLAFALGAACGLGASTAGAQVSAQKPAPPQPALRYVITELGTDATAIDASGRVAVNQGTHAFLFTPSVPNGTQGQLAPLGTLGGSVSIAKGLNDLGQVTGYSTLANGSYRAFLFDGRTLVSLGTLSADYSSGSGINATGQVVGSSYGASLDEHGFLWTPDTANGATGSMIDLGTLGGEYSEAFAVNVHGEVVGLAYTPQGAFHAFVRHDAALVDLGTLGGSYSKAEAINDDGLIVGQAYLAGNTSAHACLWDAGPAQDLGSLGGSYSEALAIDPAGETVVGTATVPGGQFLDYHAFVWNAATDTMRDLNDALPPGSDWSLQEAKGVNARGQIVGRGTLHGQARGFLLTPR
jgi:probable HAF family extracellular repeat protein